jgi:Rrf2 family iron-sulfur cluster assembly transcriptional regulator
MMVTAKVQYALVLLREIRDQADGRPVKLKIIAQKHQLDLNFLEQIARSLRIHNVLRSVRGPGGGYIANRELVGMNLLEIMDAVEAAKDLKQAVPSEDGSQLTKAVHAEVSKALAQVVAL